MKNGELDRFVEDAQLSDITAAAGGGKTPPPGCDAPAGILVGISGSRYWAAPAPVGQDAFDDQADQAAVEIASIWLPPAPAARAEIRAERRGGRRRMGDFLRH
jgi:hypothetical protein